MYSVHRVVLRLSHSVTLTEVVNYKGLPQPAPISSSSNYLLTASSYAIGQLLTLYLTTLLYRGLRSILLRVRGEAYYTHLPTELLFNVASYVWCSPYMYCCLLE